MILSNLLIAIPLMVVLVIFQVSVLPLFPILGVVPSLPFLFALAWGLIRGVNEGAIWAFLGGFFMDLFSIAPFGGSALTYLVAIVGVILIHDFLPRNRLMIPMLLASVATIIQQILYYLYLGIFGYDIDLNSSMLSLVLLQAILFLPIYWLLYFIQRQIWPKPVEL